MNEDTKRNDTYLRGETPLPAVVKITVHNHANDCADGMRLLRCLPETREKFISYFEDGMKPCEAVSFHESVLLSEDNGAEIVANSLLNPTQRTVHYWHDSWLTKNFGKDFNPIERIRQKIPDFQERGKTP